MGTFRFLTAGESHGRGLVAIAEGMVAGLRLEEDHINRDLKRRQQGYGRGPRMKIEEDRAEIISGVRYGLTTGSPISLFIANRDWENWQQHVSVSPVEHETEPVTRPRPGHADLAGVLKYGLGDIRPVIERASARETAARVAVGAVARVFLEQFGIAVGSHTLAIGKAGCDSAALRNTQRLHTPHSEHHAGPDTAPDMLRDRCAVDWQRVEASPVRCADAASERAMMAAIDEAKAAGDTLGGVFEVVAVGVPLGLGSHVSWDRRLDGTIARSLMSINAVKGVEIGSGFALAELLGSQAHDAIEPATPVVDGDSSSASPRASAAQGWRSWRRPTNHAGGIEGGMSNGENIVVRAAVKPVATLADSLPSIDLVTGRATEAHYERSDVCIVPAAGVIAEAMLAIVLADAFLEKFGGDNLAETMETHRRYLKSIGGEWHSPEK